MEYIRSVGRNFCIQKIERVIIYTSSISRQREHIILEYIFGLAAGGMSNLPGHK